MLMRAATSARQALSKLMTSHLPSKEIASQSGDRGRGARPRFRACRGRPPRRQQDVNTRDNVSVKVNAMVYLRVVDHLVAMRNGF
jgi:regulator of protease activity HflC (stomatin/prohibitin superfamily)